MLITQDKQQIARLIKEYAGNISTDAMIAFVADTSALLSVCQKLIKSNNQDDKETISWVCEQCFKYKVDAHGFLFEVEQIVSIFQPGQGENTVHYETLGLDEEATDDEVKQAYRELSRKYHPDTSSSPSAKNSDKFIKINKAYHSLIEAEPSDSHITVPSVTNAPWRKSPKSNISRAQKKKNLIGFAVLAIAMIIISLIIARNYKKRLMFAGLQSSRATLTPTEKTIDKKETSPEQELKTVAVPQKISSVAMQQILPQEVISKATSVKQDPELVKQGKTKNRARIVTASKVKGAVHVAEIDVDNKYVSEKTLKNKEDSLSNELAVLALQPDKKLSKAPEEAIPKITKSGNTLPISKFSKKVGTTDVLNKALTLKQKTHEVGGIDLSPPAPIAPEVTASIFEKSQDTIQQRIDIFLTAYTKSYKDKDLLKFTSFYDIKAKENEKPLADIVDTYSDLFRKSATILLSVTVLKWSRKQKNIRLDGRFQIQILYKDSTQFSGKGQISFILAEVREQFKIKELTYKFDAL